MTTEAPAYTCPGIELPQPAGAPWEGYVACYRAGHECPPKEPLISQDAEGRSVHYRCPCCGDGGVFFYEPAEVTS